MPGTMLTTLQMLYLIFPVTPYTWNYFIPTFENEKIETKVLSNFPKSHSKEVI